jgi:hypothetical protein
MRRIWRVLLLGLLGGCDSGGGFSSPGLANSGPPAATAQLRVRFGGLVDTIEIGAVERLALRAAELVAPDGTATRAGAISVDAAPRLATGQWAQSNPWQDPVTGNSALVALTLRNAQVGAALQSQQRLLAIVSSAEIPLADPVAYRRDWAQYRIRLTFGTPPGEVETREIPAPAPPPR